MNFKKRLYFILFFLIGITTFIHAQIKKLDTTVTVGNAGYKVSVSNKYPTANDVSLKPVGFEKEAQGVRFEAKGKVAKVEVDDLNNDGFPDIVLYVYSGENFEKGEVIAISSEENKGMRPIAFPELWLEPKLNEGYKGYDTYMLLEGTLLRSFPVYNVSDTAHPVATGIIRHIQYRVVPGDRGALKFKIVRSYEGNKQ